MASLDILVKLRNLCKSCKGTCYQVFNKKVVFFQDTSEEVDWDSESENTKNAIMSTRFHDFGRSKIPKYDHSFILNNRH